jgi:hypothetical protein
MEFYQFDDLSVILEKEGSCEYSKVSYPVRYGRFSEIRTSDTIFQFNLNGEIKYLQGRPQSRLHPAEWLKRTVGNDWIYYSAGDYSGIYDLFGEYYFPCLSYSSNSIMDDNPFRDPRVKSAMRSWQKIRREAKRLVSRIIPQNLKDFLIRINQNDARVLRLRSHQFHHLIGGTVTVLPPDARHVDYEVVPIIVADGCLYNCGFCRVKSGQGFALRSRENILEQIRNLKRFYARDLHNYNAIFLGHHDALSAGQELLDFVATTAYEIFDFEHSYLKEARLFLFGSPDSMIHSKASLFESLNRLPFSTYINIGLESADAITLAALEKPVPVEKVYEAFERMIDINKTYEKIEVTANFVFGGNLPPSHLPSLSQLTQKRLDRFYNKGCVYLSPLVEDRTKNGGSKREMLRGLKKLKAQIPLPTFAYLIQRL